ncbi:hypothetical protein ACVR1I_03055 [Streptococcus cameli]
MYRVENNITHQSWTVTSRDDLLSELELMDARRKPLDPRQEMIIYHLTEDGEILDKILLIFPLEATIDLLLENFGQSKKTGILSWMPGLFRRKTKVSKEEMNRSEKVEEIMEETREDSPQEQHSEEVNDDKVDAVLESVTLPNSSSQNEEDSIFSHTYQESKEELQVPSKTFYEEGVKSSSESVQEVDVSMSEQDEEVLKSPVITSALSEKSHSVIPRGAESLSTYALQLEFEERIQREVSLIDEQIEQLMKRKKEHLHLLSSIRQLELQ